MKKILVFALTLVLALCCFSSCTEVNEPESGKIQVITTIFPVYDWARNVAGDKAEIIYLDKSGTDMHSYQPTAADIVAIGEAEVFIYIGGVSDEWVENTLKSAENPSLKTLSLMEITGGKEEETAEGMEIHAHEENSAELDEHIWLSLKKAMACVEAISTSLCEADKENADFYNKNAQEYNNKILNLDRQFESAVSAAKRKTLLFADRFPFLYFTEDYNLEYFAAFPGCSAESEASFETISFLIEKTNELALPYIIILENSLSDLAQTIAAETGAQILQMNSCQSVAKKDIDSGFTYLEAMEANLKTVTEALN